ncbi:aspartate/glutamate racemase family protein [Thermodesulfobacteriota bacterium]
MDLKILALNIIANQGFGPDHDTLMNGFMKMAEKMAGPGTEVTLGYPEKGCRPMAGVLYPGITAMANAHTVERVIQAEEEGYDAVIILAATDEGLLRARAAVNIPVTSTGEASIYVAQLLGHRFGIVVVDPVMPAIIESNLRQYGFRDNALGLRPVRVAMIEHLDMVDACREKPERLIEKFEKVAWELIRDGADVIIAGESYIGPAFSLAGYTEIPKANVPLVDCGAAALKMAELLAALHKSLGLRKSNARTSPYRTPDKALLDKARSYYFGKTEK